MRIAIIWFSLLVLLEVATAQSVVFYPSTKSQTINPSLRVFTSSDTLEPGDAYLMIQQGKLREINSKTTPGFSNDIFWIHFTLSNTGRAPLLLELDNPHIDYVSLYEVRAGLRSLGSTGDRVPFSFRTYPNRKFVFPLSENTYSEYLLRLDKRHAAMSFPLKIWEVSAFEEREGRELLLFGVFFGIMGFVGLASLLAGLGLKDRLFIYYALYVISISIYLFTNLGLSFQYFYPNSSELNSYFRVYVAVFSSIFGTLFFSRFLSVKAHFPKIELVFRGIIYFMLFVIAGWFLLKAIIVDYYRFTIPLLNIFYLLQTAIILLLFWVLAKTYSRQPQTVLVFILAFGAVLAGSITFILIEYGLLSELNFPLNPIMLGSILEALIFSISMIIRVKRINDSRNQLASQMRLQQKELMQAFVKGGERERNRISGELHDHIGSQLALLKLKVENGKFKKDELGEELSRVCDDVRSLSHQLIPHEMSLAGLYQTLKSHCKKFSQATGIQVNLDQYSFPDLPQDMAMHLFRVVEESLHNVKKHAQATEVEIQLFGYEHELVLTIEDDGIGFDRKLVKYGYGLSGMKSRVEAFSGTFELNSVINKGTSIIIHIPLSKTPIGVKR